MRTVVLPIVVVTCLVAASAFTISKYSDFEAASNGCSELQDQLSESEILFKTHPEVYCVNAKSEAKLDLKRLVQESGAKNGISVLYLSETERDAGESIRERNVLSRIVNVQHQNLVSFMADLEARGGGARIKEIRIKPRPDKADIYQEAEIVLAVRWLVEKPQLKEPVKETNK